MDESQGRILIVEDDAMMRRSLRTTLDALGFDIGEARNGEEALTRLRMMDYEVVLLDVNMPGMGGVEACRRIRASFARMPILMLTVRDEEDDKVEALEAGADDYITKPFRIRELTARVRTAVRRQRTSESTSETTIVIGDLTLDTGRRLLERQGSKVHLTPHEFEALQLLMAHAGRPVPHARLHAVVRGSDSAVDREYLRVLIGQLRKKIEEDVRNPTYLLTDSYVGYRFRDT